MKDYWTHTAEEVAGALGVSVTGLSTDDAERRLERFGANEIRRRKSLSRMRVLWRQVRSPLILLLVFAAIASAGTGEWVDASIVAAILGASIGIGYHREYRAETAISELLDRIVGITACYVLASEAMKKWFYRATLAHPAR